MSDETITSLDVTAIERPPGRYYQHITQHHVRTNAVDRYRIHAHGSITMRWAARELLFHLTKQNPDCADAIFVVSIGADDGLFSGQCERVSTPLPGRRIVKLHYDWSAVAAYVDLPPARFSSEILSKLGEPGELLRARMRAEQRALSA